MSCGYPACDVEEYENKDYSKHSKAELIRLLHAADINISVTVREMNTRLDAIVAKAEDHGRKAKDLESKLEFATQNFKSSDREVARLSTELNRKNDELTRVCVMNTNINVELTKQNRRVRLDAELISSLTKHINDSNK